MARESGDAPVGNGRAMRADARRNRDRILAAAGAAVARDGADASLEEIARQAGVGSATLHRHFPSRRARELAGNAEPGPALVVWLRTVGAYVAATRGLAASLLDGAREGNPPQGDACYAMVADAGGGLLRRAREAGAVRPGVSIGDLLALVNAISLAAEHGPGGTAEADRLLALAIDGIRPHSHAIEAAQPH